MCVPFGWVAPKLPWGSPNVGPGAAVVGRWSLLGPSQVRPCEVVPRPVPGGGSRLSLEKARTQRVAGDAPRPPWFMARSFPLARFGVVGRSGAVVGLFRGSSTCPDLGAFFRGIFWGHIGGHVEQNSVCRDTNAVDERNQPHFVFWLYFIIFLQYFPLFFRISLPPWGALLSAGGSVGTGA